MPSSGIPAPSSEPAGREWLSLGMRAAHVAVGVSRISDQRIVDVNAAFTRLFGYAREELIGRTALELGIWPDTTQREQLMQWLVRGGSVTGFEGLYRNKAGEVGDLLISARMVTIEGEPHLIGFLSDNTEKKRLEEGLRIAQNRLRIIFAASQILAFHQDPDLRYTWVANPALGATEADLIGRTDPELLGAEGAALIAIKRRVLATGIAAREDVFVRKAGLSGWFDLIVEPERDAAGVVTGILCAATNITERKAAEAVPPPAGKIALEARPRLWAESFEHAEFGLAISDVLTDTFIAVNPAFARERGYTPDELVGRPVTTIVAAAATAALRRRRAELENKPHAVYETEHVCKDGRVFPVLVDLTIVRAKDGTPLSRVAHAVDITERKAQERRIAELHAALDQRASEAESATRAKMAFIANMSHELRTPLNAITGMAALMRREELSAEQRDRLDKLDGASAQLLEVVTDLLDISQIEAGNLTLETLPLDIDALVQGVVAALGRQVRGKPLTIVAEVEPMPGGLRGDPARIRQALLKYAANAVKFTEVGTVALRARIEEDNPTDVLLRFDVVDTGIGVEQDVLQRLFTPFEQGDNTMRRRFGGTGLGLAITRRLATMMGGAAGAESTFGLGSTFWFTARVARGTDRRVAVSTIAVDPENSLRTLFAGARVLVVESEPLNRLIVCDLLRLAGMTVEEACDGAQAEAMVSSTRYDFILMEMQLPGMDSEQTARRIRLLPDGRQVPILGLSSFADDRAPCLAAGMDDFLLKPVEPELLYAKVLDHLSRRAQGTGAAD